MELWWRCGEHIGFVWRLGDAGVVEGVFVDQPRHGTLMFDAAKKLAPASPHRISDVAKGYRHEGT